MSDQKGTPTSADAITDVTYKIVKTISHSKNTLNINFKDFLVQTNVPDPLCDESWSVGLLRVKILNTTP